MFPFFKPLEEITEDDLNLLKTEKVSESKSIDYKRDSYGTSDGDKKEFAKDVSSFANTSGGYIIIGIDEDKGAPTAVDGISIDTDAEILRLEALAKTGINPRIPGLQMQSIPLKNGNAVIIIQIPNSWNSPHMVTKGDDDRFYARHSGGKYRLDVDELRTAFTRSSTVTERVRNFRVGRISKIMAGETPVRIDEVLPTIALHIIPLVGVSGRQDLDIKSFDPNGGANARLFDHSGQMIFNLDGILYYHGFSHNPEGVYSYLQIFRNGSIEFVQPRLGRREDDYAVLFGQFEEEIVKFLREAEHLISLVSQDQTYFLMLTLLRVKGCSIKPRTNLFISDYVTDRIDRDILQLPEIVVNDKQENFPKIMRPAFDAVWNAAGFPASQHYDKDGNWLLEKR